MSESGTSNEQIKAER